MIEAIDTSLIDWSRAQFALTAMYHWLFVPLTLGLAVIMGTMETVYYRTGNEFWKRTAKFWMKLFGINFAVPSVLPPDLFLSSSSEPTGVIIRGLWATYSVPRWRLREYWHSLWRLHS